MKDSVSSATDRFVFENRKLADWLWQLVGDDASKRKAAANVVTDRFFMPTELIVEGGKDSDELQREFAAAVRAAITQPGFPTSEFVRKLLALEIALDKAWQEKVQTDFKREREADAAERAKLGDNPTAAERKRYVRRVWVQCLRDCKAAEQEPHEAMTTGTTLTWVIEALGAELLAAADLLREMLFSKHKASLASDAIVRMGRAGLEFYDDLLRGLKTENSNHCFGKALGAVLKVAPEKIPELLVLTDSSSVAERSSALVALAYCGKRATECYPEVETRLLAILKSNPEDRIWYSTTWALGECARTSASVDALLARLDSGDMARKGEIITALGTIGIEAERVVPRLIEMLDAYEEYDPDQCYHGEHERVVSALRGFGNAASPAVPALVRHIWEKPTQQWTDSTTEPKLVECANPDEEVITLLGELGALARDALPALLEVREQMRQRNHADESEDESSYWNLAIQRIQNATYER